MPASDLWFASAVANPLRLTPAQYWLRYLRYPLLLARLVFFVLVAGGVWWVLQAISAVLVPIFLALLLAYLLDPAVDWFEDRGFNRTTGIALFALAGGGLLAVFALFLYPTVSHIGQRIVVGVPDLLTVANDQWLPWLEDQVGFTTHVGIREIFAELTTRASDNVPDLLGRASASIANAWSRTGALASGLVNLVLIPILTFYFLRDFDDMKAATAEYLPVRYEAWVLGRLSEMDRVVGAWIRGQIEVSVILGVMYAVGLAVTFGLYGPDPASGVVSGIAVGMVGGLLNIVPYLGFVIAFVMAVLLALLDWTGPEQLVGVLLTFGVAQALEGYVVTPRIVGEKVGLSPVVVIIALLLGAEVLGLLGILLAIPVVGSLRVLLPDLIALYKRSDLFLGELVWSPGDPPASEDPAPPQSSREA